MTDIELTILEKLVEDHWEYVEGILEASDINIHTIELIKYHYKTAFKHGFKHGTERIIEQLK